MLGGIYLNIKPSGFSKDDEEYEIVADAFDELLDEAEFEELYSDEEE